jgi:hypothetical protein
MPERNDSTLELKGDSSEELKESTVILDWN